MKYSPKDMSADAYLAWRDQQPNLYSGGEMRDGLRVGWRDGVRSMKDRLESLEQQVATLTERPLDMGDFMWVPMADWDKALVERQKASREECRMCNKVLAYCCC